MFRKSALTTGTLAILGTLAYVPAHAQVMISPILEYKFNDSGTTTSNTGYDKSANSNLNFLSQVLTNGGTNTATVAADLHGGASSGVSGTTGDVAFNNTAANGMGRVTSNGGGAARNVGAGPGATTLPTGAPAGTMNLKSFTIQGWFKSDEVLGGDARIFSNAASNPSTIVTATPNQGFYLSGQGAALTGQLQLVINNGAVTNSTAAFLGDVGTWTFYAATYDGTTGLASFYRGTTSTGVTAVGTGTYNLGTASSVQYNPAFFALGNFPNPDSTASFARPLDAFLDDTRLYGDTLGNAGALNITQLETLRTADVLGAATPVLAPEPSQFAALGLGVLGLAGLAFKARKRSQLA